MTDKNDALINDFYDQNKSYEAQDTLGFLNGKNVFVNVLTSIKPPVTIGLYGSWGSGKSWMIEGLKQDLKNTNCLTLVFDAWKYRHEKNLVLPILYKLSKDYLQDKPELQKSIKRVISAVGLSATNIALKLATQGAVGLSEIKEALDTAEQGETKFDKYSDQIESLEIQYKKVTGGILKEQNKEKLVIFIDNLDRCLPDTVVNLLEDISSFLSIRDVSCIYVLVMDKINVIKAINNRYKDFDGRQYLEKIVQIPLKMPSSEREDEGTLCYFLKRYKKAKGIETNSKSRDGRDQIYTALKEAVQEVFVSGYLVNPRRAEHVVNKFITLEKLATFRIEHTPQDVPLALFLILLAEFHQTVYDTLRTKMDYEYLQTIIQVAQQKETTPIKFRKDRDNGYQNYKVSNFKIADEYCDNEGFYELLKGFQFLGNFSDFVSHMQRVKSLLQLIG